MAVRRLGALDHLAEPGFDRFTQQAADGFDAPIALLTLLRHDMLWVKAASGVEVLCIPREQGFCGHAIDRAEPLEVCDTRLDPLFKLLPSVVAAPYIRYYFGAPLILMNGTAIGALCVLDTQPRTPASRDQRAYLRGLARQATQALEREAHIKRRSAA